LKSSIATITVPVGDGGRIVEMDDESDCTGSKLPPKLVSVGLSANVGNEAAL